MSSCFCLYLSREDSVQIADPFDSLKNAYLTVTGELRLAFDEDAAIAFGESVGTWPAFPDSSESLGRLKKLGLKLIILSNVDNVSFERWVNVS